MQLDGGRVVLVREVVDNVGARGDPGKACRCQRPAHPVSAPPRVDGNPALVMPCRRGTVRLSMPMGLGNANDGIVLHGHETDPGCGLPQCFAAPADLSAALAQPRHPRLVFGPRAADPVPCRWLAQGVQPRLQPSAGEDSSPSATRFRPMKYVLFTVAIDRRTQQFIKSWLLVTAHVATVEHGVAGAPRASRFHGVTRKRSPSLTAFSSCYETLPLLRDQPATFSSDAPGTMRTNCSCCGPFWSAAPFDEESS